MHEEGERWGRERWKEMISGSESDKLKGKEH